MKRNDEFLPTCQAVGCGSNNFVGKIVEVDRAEKEIGLLSCVSCGHVVGAFAGDAHHESEQAQNAASAKSPCCGATNFVAYLDRYSSGFSVQPALILCGRCEKTVVGTIPSTDVWPEA